LFEELAIGPQPLCKEDLIFLRDSGIESILSVCYENEIKILEEIKEVFNHRVFSLPDHKTGKLPSLDEVYEVIEIINQLAKIGPVYVHCFAGIERSPLVCMAYLVINHRLKPQQALDYLMQVHPGTNPLTNQLNLLKFLEK